MQIDSVGSEEVVLPKKQSFFQRLRSKKHEKENQANFDEINELKSKEQLLKREIKEISEQNKKENSLPIKELQQLIKQQQQEISKLKKHNDALESHEKKLIDKIDAVGKKVGSKHHVKIVRKPFLSVFTPHLKRNKISKQHKEEIANLQRQLSSVKNMQRRMENQLSGLKNENTSLKKHKDTLKEKLNKQKSKKSRKSLFGFSARANKKYKNQVAELQKQLTSVDASQQVLRYELNKFRKENTALKNQDTQLKSQFKNQEIEFRNQLKDQGAKLKNQLKTQETELKNQLDSVRRPKSLYSEVKQSLVKRRLANDRLKKAKEGEKILQQKRRELEKKQKELELKKKDLSNRKRILEKEKGKLDALKKQEKSEKTQISTLQKIKEFRLLKPWLRSDKPEKRKKIFGTLTKDTLEDNSPLKEAAKTSSKSKLTNSKEYWELIEEANNELGRGKKTNSESKIEVYKHEPFAEYIVKVMEAEEKRANRKKGFSKNKVKTFSRKKQRVREKLKKLEIEKRTMTDDEFLNKKEALNYALDKINNILRGLK
jgi:hypothetical protein